jgi:hypothetical protein
MLELLLVGITWARREGKDYAPVWWMTMTAPTPSIWSTQMIERRASLARPPALRTSLNSVNKSGGGRFQDSAKGDSVG